MAASVKEAFAGLPNGLNNAVWELNLVATAIRKKNELIELCNIDSMKNEIQVQDFLISEIRKKIKIDWNFSILDSSQEFRTKSSVREIEAVEKELQKKENKLSEVKYSKLNQSEVDAKLLEVKKWNQNYDTILQNYQDYLLKSKDKKVNMNKVNYVMNRWSKFGKEVRQLFEKAFSSNGPMLQFIHTANGSNLNGERLNMLRTDLEKIIKEKDEKMEVFIKNRGLEDWLKKIKNEYELQLQISKKKKIGEKEELQRENEKSGAVNTKRDEFNLNLQVKKKKSLQDEKENEFPKPQPKPRRKACIYVQKCGSVTGKRPYEFDLEENFKSKIQLEQDFKNEKGNLYFSLEFSEKIGKLYEEICKKLKQELKQDMTLIIKDVLAKKL